MIVLGIDLATAGARVQALEVESGATLAELRAPLPVTGSAGERTQPPRYAEVVRDLITGVTGLLGARAAEVRALSITGTSGTVVPADEHGVPVGDALLYDDPRGVPLSTDRPSAALARAGWLQAHAPAPRYLFTPDVVAASLAGRLLPSDTSHALKSAIDPVAAAWDPAALAEAGVPPESMPELVPPGRIIGTVMRPGALGLSPGVAIVSGMTDGSTGQIATGAVSEGDTVAVLGTTLVLKAVAARDIVDRVAGVYSHVAPDGRFWAGGASNTGAGVLGAEFDPARHTAAIEAVGPSPVVVYPLARPGERFPVADPAFAGFSVGLDGRPRDAVGEIARYRAVFEGVAFVERLALERLGELGVESRRHHVAGGAAASELWNRIRASVLQRPVVVSPGAGSARGAAALAAAAVTGETLAVVAERFAGERRVVDPDEAFVEVLEERYRVFLRAVGGFDTRPAAATQPAVE
ncbi:MAG TPA: FGGY-family carbohydrate kinase [Pseudolysinimonas sp.]|nr:FGGY-family carbohydrate kinase [Pseudolysinimonas sp.]